MNKVVTINIGGNAYQLEEGAFDALRRYLDDARATLEGNPDKDEIVADLEQAIAGKCSAYLSAHKTVVTSADMHSAIEQMGPVREGHAAGDTPPHAAPIKKLYRLRDGGVILGVCAGLAAYFNIDVTLVRIIALALTTVTGGGFIFAYLLAVVFIPEATTQDARAAAHGTAPLTAQDLIDRAKQGYEHFKNSDEWRSWKHDLHQQHKQWKQQRHEQRRQWKRHQGWQDRGYRPSIIGELIGLVWSVMMFLVLLFALWYLYHHVGLIHDFFDTLHVWWDSFWIALSGALGR